MGDQTLGIAEISRTIRYFESSVSDTLESCLARIAKEDTRHHAFKSRFVDEARAQARILDAELAAGKWRGPLHGIPVAVKDNIDVAGHVTSAGSLARHVDPAEKDAPVISRLREAGAIVIGHTHMVEFAFGGWGTNTAMGTPRNALDAQCHRVPGGSSSGSAVAVAAGLVPLALGTDTGGSVRIPAAMNGLTGFKPSWGAIPSEGLTPLSERFDVIGPMGHSVLDRWMLYQVLTGAPQESLLAEPDRPLRIGVVDPVQYGSCSSRVLAAFEDACLQLREYGITLEPFVLPIGVEEVLARTACIIGHDAVSTFGQTLAQNAGELDRGVRYRLTDASKFTAEAYAEECAIRTRKCEEMESAMAGFDALVFPTTPILPPRVDDIIERGMPLGDLTRVVNYLDLCAMALPTAWTEEGLRHSIQVIGSHGNDASIFAISVLMERVLGQAYGAR